MIPKLLTIEDLTEALGIGKTTAYKLVRKISHTKIGRRILVKEDDLQEYIQSQMSASEEINDKINILEK